MSLESPSKLDWFWRLAPAVKAIIVVVALTVIIGVILFASDRISGWWSTRDINKARANVNAAMNDVKNAKDVVVNDRVDEAVALEKVDEAVKEVIEASTATDEAKEEARKAMANYNAAVAAGRPTGTTEADLDAKLRALGQ